MIEFSLSYITEPQAPARFFHLHPFGFTPESAASGRLLPELAHEGALYIGIGDLRPPQRLTLLVQVADGTANPLKREHGLQWHYLRGNDVDHAPGQAVDDKTRNLTGSGIVGLAVPADADTGHTILPAGLHWFRMAAAADPDALNNLRELFAQAGVRDAVRRRPATPCSWLDRGRPAPSPSSRLPMRRSRRSASPSPPSAAGRRRVRACVRDPGQRAPAPQGPGGDDVGLRAPRAGALPAVYRVRCINHTELVRDAANSVLADNEVKPGHVLVVTVPYVRSAGAGDPLRPYTDTRTLRRHRRAFCASACRPSCSSRCRTRSSRRCRSSSR